MKVNDSLRVYGPGHHTLFSYGGEDYMLYHRHRLPFVKGTAYRQTCISKLTFDDDKNEIKNIIPYHTQAFPDLVKEKREYIQPESVISNSVLADYAGAENTVDHNYSTRWESADGDENPTLTVSFGDVVAIDTVEVRFEYPWEKYYMKVETSVDGKDWNTVTDCTKDGISGSPVSIPVAGECKFVRLAFAVSEGNTTPSVWELLFY